jgi:hypothetical protein
MRTTLTVTCSVIEELITEMTRSSSFWVPQNLSDRMDKQARTANKVLVTSKERRMAGAKHCRGGWGKEG